MDRLEQQIVDSYSWACHYASCCTANFSNNFDREELKSVGILGYIVAASRYDERRGYSFRGYCATRIRGAIMDELRRSSWEPRSARRNHQMIAQKILDLEAELQINPTHAELAKSLGIEVSDLIQMQRLSRPARCISLDEDSNSNGDEESLPLKEILADESALAPSDVVDSAEIRRALCASISKLSPSEASVIVLHYMRNMPFHEIAQLMKLTPSRISQLHHNALNSMKKRLKKEDTGLCLKNSQ
jgi:RNA polymerase sigma factor for flagellar operon FliA